MMYSPVCCGGIQYTQHKMPKKNTNTRGNSGVHAFKGCREIFLTPSPRIGINNSVASITTAVDGSANFAQVICPLGLTSTTLGASSYAAGTLGNVTGPPLRGLYSRGSDFQWYRVTRARFIFVGNVGSTSAGIITLNAYSDPGDVSIVGAAYTSSGASTKTFDLASSSNKELSVPIPVDASWKKVSSTLTIPGNVYPFTAANAGSIAVLNTVSDLCCGAVNAYVSGAPASTTVGAFYIDYDVEFKGPVDIQVNL